MRKLRLMFLLLASVVLLCSCSNSEPRINGDKFEEGNSQEESALTEAGSPQGTVVSETTEDEKNGRVDVENQKTDWDTFECMYFGDIPVGLLTTPDATTKEVEYFINQRFGTDRVLEIHRLYNAFQEYQIEVDDLFSFYGCKGQAVFCFDWNKTLSTITFEFYDDSGITPEVVQALHSDLEEMLGLKKGWLLDEEPAWDTTTCCIWNSEYDGAPFKIRLSSYFSSKYPMKIDFEFGRTIVRIEENMNAVRSFTNKYGTRNTICAHSGCTNCIATSGNTNCCTTHSNRCYECGCYIDEDASWCVDCLAKATKQAQQNKTRYCEECGSTADYSIIGITGNKEYYCYKHYKEMQELMKWMLEN